MSDCRHRSRSRYSQVMGLFRREFATILYYSGVDILDAIRIFGHADAREMLEIYAELRVDESNSKSKINTYLEQYTAID